MNPTYTSIDTVLVPDPVLASREFLTVIPREFARNHGILSQGHEGDAELVAIVAGCHIEAVWNTRVRLRRKVVTRIVDPEALHHAIDLAYERHLTEVAPIGGLPPSTRPITESGLTNEAASVADLDELLNEANRDLLSSEGKAPLVKLADRLVFSALQLGASDLHIQPTPKGVLVRQRIDGELDAGKPLPMDLFKPLVSRFKVMGGMDVAERLMPQDGRATVAIGERTIDVRISTIPTAYGERVVLRLLDSRRNLPDLAALGMPNHVLSPFCQVTQRASGIVLVTGPTGSGKTTTLYATLRSLHATKLNIMTIEDPIEYELYSEGVPISQSQVNLRKGVNFVNGMRHILRQDPDVIMVGEIRDAETAHMAIQASLTGHLVLSTLHTNDAVSAVTRLLDLGIEPHLVASSLSAVMAQRLVRVICVVCKAHDPICPACRGTGFKGRTGIFEWFEITEALREGISKRASNDELRSLAVACGMHSLGDEGRVLVEKGLTTCGEVELSIHHG